MRLLALALTVLLVGVPSASQLPSLQSLTQLRNDIPQRASSSDADWRNGNRDARPIEPGETLVLADLKGPGKITHIWCTVATAEPQYSRLLVLRIYWDREEHPSVECPLGDFCAMGHGWDVSVGSLPVRVTANDRARNGYWVMPFRKSARVTVTDEGRLPMRLFFYNIDWRQLRGLPRDTAHFHAMYRQEFPTAMGRNYLLADIGGRGHYVGTMLSVRQLASRWWGEGDEFFFIDGESEPSLRGTGTEDYFGDASGLSQQSVPFYGAPLVEGQAAGSRSTMFRWQIPDPVSCRRSLRLEIEHQGAVSNLEVALLTGFAEREDDYSSVAFWYQTEPHKPYPPLPKGYARVFHTMANSGTEAETLVDRVIATAGEVARQELPLFSGGAQLLWTPGEQGHALGIPIEVAQSGGHLLFLVATCSFDFGIYAPELSGRTLGTPIAFYARSPLLHELVLDLGIDALFVRRMAR